MGKKQKIFFTAALFLFLLIIAFNFTEQNNRELETIQPNTGSTPVKKEGLVNIEDLDKTLIIDLRYASTNNFTGKKIYPLELCLLQEETARKLIKANNELKEMGYRIKILDAYRPHYVQQILWDAAFNKNYVADPIKGSNHNRGAAVDVTLTDFAGNELEMPSEYDEFSERAHRSYRGGPKEALENRDLLTGIMVKHGFTIIQSEWWHFDDAEAGKYPVLNLKLEDFYNGNN